MNSYVSRSQSFKFVSLAILAGATSALTACDLTSEEQSALDTALKAPSSEYKGPAPRVEPECFNERFVQPAGTVHKSIDLLFVTDTSGSLVEERGRIAEGIDSFITQLPLDVDYQIGVMLGHGSKSSHTGRLWQHSGRGPVLNSQTMSIEQIRSDLTYLLTRTASDWYSDGGEEGLYSLKRALDADRVAALREQGFFRENAALAVVFIADENDICARYPEGVKPVYDSDRLEAPAFARDCADITPESVLAHVKAHQGDRPLLIGGIVYNNHETYARSGENEYGYGYMEMIALANGITVDLAGSRYNEGLAEIGSLASIKLQLITDFRLGRPEIDPESIKIYVDGHESPHSYAPEVNEVHLEEPGIARSVVDINYCMKRDPGPPPCEGPRCGGGPIGV